jgi:hypothetical protein
MYNCVIIILPSDLLGGVQRTRANNVEYVKSCIDSITDIHRLPKRQEVSRYGIFFVCLFVSL